MIKIYKGVSFLLLEDTITPGDYIWNENTQCIDRCLEVFNDGEIGVQFFNADPGLNRAVLDSQHYKKAKVLGDFSSGANPYKPLIIHGRDEFYDLRYSELTRKQRNSVIIPVRAEPKVSRNQPCPCGSGKKFKYCCIRF